MSRGFYRRLVGAHTHALRGTLLDEFVLAHALGWWGKALAVRNGPMLWAISVLFELCELSLAVSWL